MTDTTGRVGSRWLAKVPWTLYQKLGQRPAPGSAPWCLRYPASRLWVEGMKGGLDHPGSWAQLKPDVDAWCRANGIGYALRYHAGMGHVLISFRRRRDHAAWVLAWM